MPTMRWNEENTVEHPIIEWLVSPGHGEDFAAIGHVPQSMNPNPVGLLMREIVRVQVLDNCLAKDRSRASLGGGLQEVCRQYYGNGKAHDVNKPLPTQTTKDRFGVVEPFVVRITQTGSRSPAVRSVREPLPTIVTKEELAICEPFLIPNFRRSGSLTPSSA